MSETWQRRLALVLAFAAFALASAALIIAIARRGPAPEPAGVAPVAEHGGSAAARDPLDSIVRIDDTHFEISRAAVDALLADPTQLATAVRVVPVAGGDGFRLFAVRPGAVVARLGFQNGDTIRGVNGMDVATPAQALAVYDQLRSANRLTIDLVRGDTPMQLSIAIR